MTGTPAAPSEKEYTHEHLSCQVKMHYSPGWSVMEQTLVRRERWPGGYTVQGTPLVRPGQEVVADQPVLRLERSQPVSGALPPMDEGAREGNNGVAVQTETIPSGLHGRVVDITRRGGVVIEGRAAVVRGAIGVGKQVAGVLTMWQSGKMGRAASIPAGALLVVPGPVNFAFLHQALLSNISGIIASSIELRDLEGFLRTDLISLLANADLARVQDSLPPLTLCLTEGLGTLMMPVHVTNLLSKYQGALALLSGTTSLRHELFPDLLIALPEQSAQADWEPVQPDLAFTVGARVRICGGEYEGKTGVINYLFKHQQVFSWGLRERAALLRSEDGATLVVPLALIERIG